MVRPQGIAYNTSFYHAAYRDTIADGRQWAVDLTAAQYASSEPVTPWSKYERKRIQSVNSIDPLGTMAAKMATGSDYLNTHLDPAAKKICTAQWEVGKAMDAGMAAAFEERGSIVQDFLYKMKDAEYTEMSQFLLEKGKAAMEASDTFKQHVDDATVRPRALPFGLVVPNLVDFEMI